MLLSIVPEKKALFVNFCPLWPKYPPFFFMFVTLKGFLYNREICLAALLKQNSKTNMTKNREIMI